MYILTRKSVSVTARALASTLRDGLGIGVRVVYDQTRLIRCRTERFDFLRWGNSDPISDSVGLRELELNDKSLIRTSSNKLSSSALISGAGMDCITFRRDEPTSYPVVVRKTMSGYGGDGIVVCENEETFSQYRNRYYWSNWIRFKYELGVHIVDGRIAKVFKKVRVKGESEERFPIRNLARGYQYSKVDTARRSFSGLPIFVEGFLKVFPVKLGRIDVGLNADNGRYYVIEFNSAPGIAKNKQTLDMYAEFIAEEYLK